MAGEYTINWTNDQNGANPLKPRFTINVNEINGPGYASTNSPLRIFGRFVVNYGEIVAENFLHLLENFSSDTEPASPTSGMLWFDESAGTDGTLKVRNTANDTWVSVGSGVQSSGGAGGKYEIPSAGNFTASAGGNYFIDTTSGPVTVTLPLSPVVGDVVGFTDLTGTWDVNSLLVDGNGELIMGLNEQLENNVQYNSFRLGYSNTANGWRIVS